MSGVEAWSRAVTTERMPHCAECARVSRVRPIARWRKHWAIRKSRIAARWPRCEDGGGTFKVLNLPFRMSGASVSAARRMATLGEHTVAYLRETGLSEDEIAAFTGKRLVAAPG